MSREDRFLVIVASLGAWRYHPGFWNKDADNPRSVYTGPSAEGILASAKRLFELYDAEVRSWQSSQLL